MSNRNSQEADPDDAPETRAYRTLARSFAEELQRQELRKKRMNSLAFAVTTAFFLGVILLSYLTRA